MLGHTASHMYYFSTLSLEPTAHRSKASDAYSFLHSPSLLRQPTSIHTHMLVVRDKLTVVAAHVYPTPPFPSTPYIPVAGGNDHYNVTE